jgi:hypothetical protein
MVGPEDAFNQLSSLAFFAGTNQISLPYRSVSFRHRHLLELETQASLAPSMVLPQLMRKVAFGAGSRRSGFGEIRRQAAIQHPTPPALLTVKPALIRRSVGSAVLIAVSPYSQAAP